MRKRVFFDADVVVGQYAYYADNRRASKTVTNRGELDGTTYFFDDGLREIEERSGCEAGRDDCSLYHEPGVDLPPFIPCGRLAPQAIIQAP